MHWLGVRVIVEVERHCALEQSATEAWPQNPYGRARAAQAAHTLGAAHRESNVIRISPSELPPRTTKIPDPPAQVSAPAQFAPAPAPRQRKPKSPDRPCPDDDGNPTRFHNCVKCGWDFGWWTT